MAPSVDGEIHWFAEHGLYDGLFLMRDEESGTYWYQRGFNPVAIKATIVAGIASIAARSSPCACARGASARASGRAARRSAALPF